VHYLTYSTAASKWPWASETKLGSLPDAGFGQREHRLDDLVTRYLSTNGSLAACPSFILFDAPLDTRYDPDARKAQGRDYRPILTIYQLMFIGRQSITIPATDR
jgi:hypothetical protein